MKYGMPIKFKSLILCVLVFSELSSQHKYSIECNKELLWASLDSCKSQVGIIEKKNNSGKVEKYLKLFNLKNAPYCAAGQYWCFYTAKNDLNLSNIKIPIYKSAVASEMYFKTIAFAKKVYFKPHVNDLIFWKNRNSYNGHVERIIKVLSKTTVLTIGFNTKKIINNKTFEGVFIRKRNIFHPIGRKKILGIIGFKEKL